MYDKNDKNSIKKLFDNISDYYDFINYLMTFGTQKLIKKNFVQKTFSYMTQNNLNNIKILDLCCGTGDISIIVSDLMPDAKITAVDFSEKMLEKAKYKAKNKNNINFINEDITNLPFDRDEFDICFISFGLRNTLDINETLESIRNILKPNGVISILDLSHPEKFLKPFINFYINKIIPVADRFFQNSPYKYISDSLKNYPDQLELAKMLQENGYKNVKYFNYIFGTISHHTAMKIF